jgi:hypothetical protein
MGYTTETQRGADWEGGFPRSEELMTSRHCWTWEFEEAMT